MSSERRRVLVIDDHEDLLDLVAEVLSEPGYEVTTLRGAPAAVDEIADRRPELLIIDLRLSARPGEPGGWEVIQLVRAHETLRDVPIVICSADVRQLRRRQAEIEALPRVTVLPKPFGVAELESVVRRMLTARGNGGSAEAC